MKIGQEFSRSLRRSQWLKYALAMALTGVVLLMLVFITTSVPVPNLILFVIPITLSAYWGGFKPGLLATVAAATGEAFFILDPLRSFAIVSSTHRFQVVTLLLIGTLISVICEKFHREQERVEALLIDGQSAHRKAAHLAAIVQSSDDAIIGKTLDGIVTSWNAGAERIFGYTAAEMIGRQIMQLIPAVRQDEEREILARVRRGEGASHLDTVRICKGGRPIDVSITTSAIKDASGAIIGASKVARDIKQRKLAEAALRASEQRVRLATEATAVGIWEWHIPSGRIRWDAQLFRIYGAPPTEDGFVDYSVWSNAVLPEELAAQEAGLQDAIHRLGSGSRSFRIKRYDDHAVRHIEAVETVRTNALGVAEWVLGTNLDVTERQEMQQALRDSEARFRTMVNSISQLAWIAHPDGQIFWYNQRWYEYTGTAPEDMQGSGWQSVHDKTTLPEVLAAWTEAIATGNAFEMEFPLRGADGKFRAFLTRGQPVKDAMGRVIQWVGTNTDVESLRLAQAEAQQLNTKLEQRVMRRNEQLEAANKELEAFSYSVSHDLRAPLRAIDGYSLALLDDFAAQLPGEAQRMLRVIRSGAQHMGSLIDDLLMFARLSRQPLKKQIVQMETMVKAVLHAQQAECTGRQLHVKVGALPPCYGDPAVLKQVWVNLLSNAMKYTRKREHASIEVGATQLHGETVYFVRDNGTGFDMRYADKLFGVFQRLHRAEEYEGTGVGLAMVQRIVKRHDGRIWAESAVDAGSTFYFTLQMEGIS